MHAETCQKHYLRCDWLKLFTRLCQIEIQPYILLIIICVMTGANYTRFYAIVPKQPPPNAFFEAYSLFKEKNFDLS